MPNTYQSSYTGQHNDNYEARIAILETFKETFLNTVYPIGSIYMSMNETNPSTLFGGTWERISGRFLLGCGGNGPGANNNTDFGTITTAQQTWFSDISTGNTGGQYFHTHTTTATISGGTSITEAQLPSHRHSRLYTDSGTWATQPLYGAYLFNVSPQTGNLLPNTTNWNATNANMQHTASIRTGATGSGQAHSHSIPSVNTSTISNMPPYLAVAIWKRTA